MPTPKIEVTPEPDSQDVTVNPEPATMEQSSEDMAAGVTAEDTVKAYDALFKQQRGEIDSLTKANRSLKAQIGILLRNGASVGDSSQGTQATQLPEPEKPQGPYVSLADLGAEIGKRDYATHNTKRD